MRKGQKMSEETKRKIRKSEKGKVISNETRRKLSISHLGIKPSHPFQKGHVSWNAGLKGISTGGGWNKGLHHTKATKKKMSVVQMGHPSYYSFPKGYTPHNKGVKGYKNKGTFKTGQKSIHPFTKDQVAGHKNHNWKGGITPINKKIRTSSEYKVWRTAVFTRDDYTCQQCGIRGTELHADHIKPFALYPELRLAIDNGRTLCKPCHKKTPTWGNNKNQCFLVYLNNDRIF